MSSIMIDNQEIKKGNFSFLATAMSNDRLGEDFYEMEKHYFTNREVFSGKMRIAFETLVNEEYLRLYPEDQDDLTTKLEQRMAEEKQSNSYASTLKGASKIFLVLRCCDENKVSYFHRALQYWRPKYQYNVGDVKKLILDIYAFGSASREHHSKVQGIAVSSAYEATEQNCKKYLYTFYYFVLGYCKLYYADNIKYDGEQLDENRIPVVDYIPISNSLRKSLGLRELKGKKYYVNKTNDSIKYYLCCDTNKEQDPSREIDVLQKIWADDNDNDPINIIRFKEEIRLDERRSKMFFALPSKPLGLASTMLDNMTNSDKEKIFNDAVKAISYLHESIPPLYHRDITPEAFILCKTKNGYKLFLGKFDCVKDTDENVLYTVGYKVAENSTANKKVAYIAPEVVEFYDKKNIQLRGETKQEILNWELADVYSLGMLGVFIFTGGTDINLIESCQSVSEKSKDRIKVMCAPLESRITLVQ